MFESIYVTKIGLSLDGEIIGYRYKVFFGNYLQYTWDVDTSLSSYLDKALSSVVTVNLSNKPLAGFMDKDGYFKTRFERGVIELEDKKQVKEALKGFSTRAEKYALFRLNFEDSYVETLKRELKRLTHWEESNVDIDNLCFRCRFLGGYESWSGGNGDICDAETLSNKVYKDTVKVAISNTEKKIGDKVKIEFTTGEKAWSYFYFKEK
jgi:hypothetical protein